MSTAARNVAIFIFDEVEVLDFAGPFEVFAVARFPDGGRPFNVYTVGITGETVRARNGLSVNPDYSFASMPQPQILLVPGGQGTRPLLNNNTVVNWLREQAAQVEFLLSVCTGALLLAKAGVLAGLSATTYHTTFDALQTLEPTVTVCPGRRWVDNGRVITSAGVSAGIDMSLHMLGRLHGADFAETTARYMEYEYWPRGDGAV